MSKPCWRPSGTQAPAMQHDSMDFEREAIMSGSSYNSVCPRCGANMACYYDWKPYDTVGGQCLECGFSYHTREARMGLKKVNSLRADAGLPPLAKLRPQTDETAACGIRSCRNQPRGLKKGPDNENVQSIDSNHAS